MGKVGPSIGYKLLNHVAKQSFSQAQDKTKQDSFHLYKAWERWTEYSYRLQTTKSGCKPDNSESTKKKRQLSFIWYATWRKRPYAKCEQWTVKVQMGVRISAVWSGHSLFVDISTYFVVCTYSVSGQRRPRSACAYAQADQGLRCPQTA